MGEPLCFCTSWSVNWEAVGAISTLLLGVAALYGTRRAENEAARARKSKRAYVVTSALLTCGRLKGTLDAITEAFRHKPIDGLILATARAPLDGIALKITDEPMALTEVLDEAAVVNFTVAQEHLEKISGILGSMNGMSNEQIKDLGSLTAQVFMAVVDEASEAIDVFQADLRTHIGAKADVG